MMMKLTEPASCSINKQNEVYTQGLVKQMRYDNSFCVRKSLIPQNLHITAWYLQMHVRPWIPSEHTYISVNGATRNTQKNTIVTRKIAWLCYEE